MKRKMVAAFLAAILVSVVGIVVAQSFNTRESGKVTSLPEVNTEADEPKASPPSQDRLPDQAFFDMLFNTVLSMEKAAANLRAEKKNDEIWKHYFKRRANLTDLQNDGLHAVTADFERAMKPVHTRAHKLINQYRAALAQGEQPSPISEQLRLLQLQRDGISTRYGNELQHRLGLPIVDKLREVMNQRQGNSTSLPEAARQELTESLRRFRQEREIQAKTQAQGGNRR